MKGLVDTVLQSGITRAHTGENSAVHGHGADFVYKCTSNVLRSGQGMCAARAGTAAAPDMRQSPEAAPVPRPAHTLLAARDCRGHTGWDTAAGIALGHQGHPCTPSSELPWDTGHLSPGG